MRATVYIPYIIFGYLSLFTLGLLDNARGPYFPDIASTLGLGGTLASFLFVTTSFVSFMIGRYVASAVKRFSVLQLVRFGHLFMAAGFFYMASITGFKTMVLAAAIFGVGYGIVNVGENILIFDGATPATQRQLLSGLHAFYALSSLFSPLLISAFISEGYSWRMGLTIFSAVPILAFIYSFFCHEQPHSSGAGSEELPPRFRRDIVYFSVGIGLYVMAEVLLCTRMVLFLNDVHGMETALSSVYLSLFFVFMLLGRLVFTFVKFKNLSNREVIRYGLGLSGVCFLYGIYGSPLFLVLTGLFMGPVFGVGIDYVRQIFPYAASQALSRVLSLQALLVVGMHFFIGLLTEYFGIQTAMLLGPVFIGLAFLIVQLEPWQKNPH